jgi:hypothetical protein
MVIGGKTPIFGARNWANWANRDALEKRYS